MSKVSRSSPADPAPPARSLRALAIAARTCRACPLFANATQAVFGEGSSSASITLVGEQPGDAEDRTGRPFVGPAGALLDRALDEAGISRQEIYVTNAVKHFKWEPRGKRRIHLKPRLSEVKACRPWLEAELKLIAPRVIVCLGTTAVQSLLGPGITIASAKRRTFESAYGPVIVTRHPSSVLRVREPADRQAAYQELVQDLRRAVDVMRSTNVGTPADTPTSGM
jgi:uracil-DNA glycosylase family protein